MSRPVGALNKRTMIQKVGMEQILTDELENKLWNGFLNSKQTAIRLKAFELALKYRHGLPMQRHEIKAEITHSLSDPEREAAKAIVAKLKG